MEWRMTNPKQYEQGDKIATHQLESIFPETWKFKRKADIYSGREGAQDLVIEIIDEDYEETGIEFVVQNKVIFKPQKRVKVAFKLSTLRYLSTLNQPVLLHVYDRNSETSYYLWLDEYYAEHSSRWKQNQNETSVVFPKNNILSKKNFRQVIETYVRSYNLRRKLLKYAENESKVDPNFYYEYSAKPGQVKIAVSTKHPDAVVNFTMQLHPEQVDKFNKAIETGTEAEIELLNLQFEGLPEWLVDKNIATASAIIFQHKSTQKIYNRFDFLDEYDKVILSSVFVEMRLDQDGTKYKKWKGISVSQGITYVIEVSIDSQTINLNFEFNSFLNSAAEYLKMLTAVEGISLSKSLKITFLEQNEVVLLPSDNLRLRDWEISNQEKQLATALSKIEKAFSVTFDMQTAFTVKDLNLVVEIADNILENGYSYKLLVIPKEIYSEENTLQKYVVTFPVTLETAKQIIESYNVDNEFRISTNLENPLALHVQNLTLDLGAASIEYVFDEILQLPDLKTFIKDNHESKDIGIYLTAIIVKEKSRFIFHKWYKDK
jgi:hypothetical protein